MIRDWGQAVRGFPMSEREKQTLQWKDWGQVHQWDMRHGV